MASQPASSSCLPEQLQPPRLAPASDPPSGASSSAIGAAKAAGQADAHNAADAADAIPNPPPPAHATSSIFSRSETAPVHLVPMRVIRRPLPSELDEDKVQTFMREMEASRRVLQAGDAFTPIELVKVRAPLKSAPEAGAQVFYFAMGGCHRYEATRRLGWDKIRARIIEVPASQMRVYLGAGSPF